VAVSSDGTNGHAALQHMQAMPAGYPAPALGLYIVAQQKKGRRAGPCLDVTVVSCCSKLGSYMVALSAIFLCTKCTDLLAINLSSSVF